MPLPDPPPAPRDTRQRVTLTLEDVGVACTFDSRLKMALKHLLRARGLCCVRIYDGLPAQEGSAKGRSANETT